MGSWDPQESVYLSPDPERERPVGVASWVFPDQVKSTSFE